MHPRYCGVKIKHFKKRDARIPLFAVHCKNGDAHKKGVGIEKEAGNGVGDVAGEIEYCPPAKEAVLDCLRQSSSFSLLTGQIRELGRLEIFGAEKYGPAPPTITWIQIPWL